VSGTHTGLFSDMLGCDLWIKNHTGGNENHHKLN